MTTQTMPTRPKPQCKLALHVDRGPQWLTVAMRGEAGFDQTEVISAQLLRIPLDGYSLVVFDLAEVTFLSSLAMAALIAYRWGLCRRGVEVRLANVPAPIWLALESAGLGQLLPLVDWAQPTPAPAVAAD
jgi:anti-anti-sigma regulatory factor